MALAEVAGVTGTATTGLVLANVDGDRDLDLIAGNASQAKVCYASVEVKVTRIALDNMRVTFSGQGLTGGQGVFILTNEGIAGTLSGTISVTAADNLAVGGTISARVKTFVGAIDETIQLGGQTRRIQFASAEVPFEFKIDDFIISIGEFVTLEGNLAFAEGSNITATGVRVFLGDGPAFLDQDGQEPNPTAQGILLKDATVGYKKVGATYALYATGEVQVLGIPGVTFVGRATAELNTTDSSVTFDFNGTDLDPDTAGIQDEKAIANNTGFKLSGDLTLTTAGVDLVGTFGFERNADGTIKVTLDDVDLNLGEANGAGEFPVRFTIGHAQIELLRDGIVAVVDGAVPHLNFEGFELSGAVNLRINTTPNPVTRGSEEILANSVRAEIANTDLTLLGQTLNGDFVFEQITGTLSPQAQNNPNAKPPKTVRIAANNVGLVLGSEGATPGLGNDGDSDAGVQLSRGSGYFIVTPAGIAGRLSTDFRFDIPGDVVRFEGTFGLVINTTTRTVNEEFKVGPETINFTVSAGPYLRLEGAGITLRLLSQRVGGDFVFEQTTVAGGQNVVRVLARNVDAGFGDGTTDFVTLDGGYGFFVLRPDPDGTGPLTGGLAGEIGGDVSVNLPGVELSGRLSLAINNTAAPILEAITFGPQNNATTAVVIGDVNGDTLPDLITGNRGQETLVYLNDGSGDPFDSLAAIPIGAERDPTTALALADLNGDGAPDLLVGNAAGAPNRVYLNFGDGTFLLADPAKIGSIGDNTGNGTTALAVADVDGDKDLDLVVGRSGATSQVYRNKGLNTADDVWAGFDAPVAVGAAGNTTALVLANLDQDDAGTVELLIASQGAPVQLFLNNGTGTFAGSPAAQFAASAAAATALAVGDVNRDGFLDVVVGVSGANNQLFLNRGKTNTTWNGFAAATEITGASATTAVVLVDFDTDGDLDILEGTGGAAPGGISHVYLNSGNGTFTLGPAEKLGNVPHATTALAVGDLNLDGNVDLVTAVQGKPSLIHLNDEGGNLGAGVELGVVRLDLPAGPYLQVRGEDVVVVVAGQRITGTFEFTQQSRPDGQRIVTVNIPTGTINLGDGLATVAITNGSLLITDAGVAARLPLAAGLSLGPVTLEGSLDILVNTGRAPIVLTDLAQTRVPGGPFFRIEGSGIRIAVGDFKLTGNFVVESQTNTGGQRRITLAASGVNVTNLDGQPLFGAVSVTDGAGLLLVLPDPDGTGPMTGGLAGTLSASVDLSGLMGGVTVRGTFAVSINQTRRAITESVVLANERLTLDLPAGPYLRVEGRPVELVILDQSLRGNFAFEEVTSLGADGVAGGTGANEDTKIVRIAASDVALRLGDGQTSSRQREGHRPGSVPRAHSRTHLGRSALPRAGDANRHCGSRISGGQAE